VRKRREERQKRGGWRTGKRILARQQRDGKKKERKKENFRELRSEWDGGVPKKTEKKDKICSAGHKEIQKMGREGGRPRPKGWDFCSKNMGLCIKEGESRVRPDPTPLDYNKESGRKSSDSRKRESGGKGKEGVQGLPPGKPSRKRRLRDSGWGERDV